MPTRNMKFGGSLANLLPLSVITPSIAADMLARSGAEGLEILPFHFVGASTVWPVPVWSVSLPWHYGHRYARSHPPTKLDRLLFKPDSFTNRWFIEVEKRYPDALFGLGGSINENRTYVWELSPDGGKDAHAILANLVELRRTGADIGLIGDAYHLTRTTINEPKWLSDEEQAAGLRLTKKPQATIPFLAPYWKLFHFQLRGEEKINRFIRGRITEEEKAYRLLLEYAPSVDKTVIELTFGQPDQVRRFVEIPAAFQMVRDRLQEVIAEY